MALQVASGGGHRPDFHPAHHPLAQRLLLLSSHLVPRDWPKTGRGGASCVAALPLCFPARPAYRGVLVYPKYGTELILLPLSPSSPNSLFNPLPINSTLPSSSSAAFAKQGSGCRRSALVLRAPVEGFARCLSEPLSRRRRPPWAESGARGGGRSWLVLDHQLTGSDRPRV